MSIFCKHEWTLRFKGKKIKPYKYIKTYYVEISETEREELLIRDYTCNKCGKLETRIN